MSKCIYCRSEVPHDASREHVIPQSFGVFKPDITLDCVCKQCNHYFGSKLEWRMRVESLEGMRRLQFGLKGVVGGMSLLKVKTKGARVMIRANGNGVEETVILTQVLVRETSR